jgi:hypothetical protein
MIDNALIGRGEYDWQAGGNSPIVRKVLLKGGNWKENAIPNEIQVVNYGSDNQYDTSMCVSFGITDAIEYNLMEMLRQSLIPAETAKWLKEKGYFENGSLNFSERFIAVKGETKSNGAYMYKVANAVKNFGLIPNKMFPMADNFADNIDPKFITKEMEDLGKEFLTHLAINYEWVEDFDTKEYLEYSALPCIGQFANYVKESDILNPNTKNGHCMTEVFETEGYTETDYKEIDDSYWQQFKKYKKDKLQAFMAFYLTPLKGKTMEFNAQQFIEKNDTNIIRNSNTGSYGVIYRKIPMKISPERAGLFCIDREARGIIGKSKLVTISDPEWNQLNWVNF